MRSELHDAHAVLLSPTVVSELQAQLPHVAALTLTAIADEVTEYARTLTDDLAGNFRSAIGLALGAFLRLLEGGAPDADTPLDAARRGAYELGRGEAVAGRTVDALLAAYRIGARVAWREMSSTAVAHDVAAPVVARFAELVFAYIDELSAASVAGHADQIAASGRLRAERRERLARALLAGAAMTTLLELARKADWPVPETLTAVLLPSSAVREVLGHLATDTLSVPADTAEISAGEGLDILLVRDAVRTRERLVRAVDGHGGVVGPARPWPRVRESVDLSVRARRLVPAVPGTSIDTARHLDMLVVGADLGALRDLRAAVLAPLAELPPATSERLAETLRSWLLHLGRRSDVADELHIHPQTVRYRMTQVRDLYGDRLDDPAVVQALTVALSLQPDDAPADTSGG